MTRYICTESYYDRATLLFKAGEPYFGSDLENISSTGRVLMNRKLGQGLPVFLTPAEVARHFKIAEEEYTMLTHESPRFIITCGIATAVTIILILAGLYFAFLY